MASVLSAVFRASGFRLGVLGLGLRVYDLGRLCSRVPGLWRSRAFWGECPTA